MKYLLIAMILVSGNAQAYDFNRTSEHNRQAQENMQREMDKIRQEQAIQDIQRQQKQQELRTQLQGVNAEFIRK